MLSQIAWGIDSRLMEGNAHQVSPEKIGAVQQEDLVVTKSAIAIGSGWLSLDVSHPVICRQWFNVVFLFGIVAAEISAANKQLIGTVPYQVAPTDLITVSGAVILADFGIQLCCIAISPGGEISQTKPQWQKDILWRTLGGLIYLIGNS